MVLSYYTLAQLTDQTEGVAKNSSVTPALDKTKAEIPDKISIAEIKARINAVSKQQQESVKKYKRNDGASPIER
jgi:hypothetical protein